MEPMKDNKICIFTTFYMVDPAYSLCNVVEDQIKMLVSHDYKIKVLVDEEFKNPGGIWAHPNVTYGICPKVQRDNDGILKGGWQEEVEKMHQSLKKELEGYKVVIAHDVILQPAHLVHNIASRRLILDRPDLRWLHWCHSSTAPQVRCSDETARKIIQQKFPNSFMCYPNDWDRKRVALNYGYELDDVKCVHHPSDFLSLMFGDEIKFEEVPNLSEEAKQWLDKKVNYPIKISKDLVREFDILNADVIAVYPCRLDRGKQVEWPIKILSKIKQTGRTVRLIVFDFHSTGGDKVVYRDELKRIGKEWGMELPNLIFISEWREDTNLHVPRETVMNLRKIADLHIHPSTSETYSLVIQEAMIWRNLCLLNHHTPYMRDIYGSKNVLYESMGGAVDALTGEDGSTLITVNDPRLHFENIAKKVIYFLEEANPVINQWRFIRQKRSLEYVFKMELEPLFYAGQ